MIDESNISIVIDNMRMKKRHSAFQIFVKLNDDWITVLFITFIISFIRLDPNFYMARLT